MKMINKTQAEANQPLFFTMDKELIKQIPKVANDPFYSIDSNWYRVSFVFKHNGSKKRFVPSFRNFNGTKKLKIRQGMNGGDGYSLKKIIISKSDRSHLVIRDFEITGVSDFDFTLLSAGAGGGGSTPEVVQSTPVAFDTVAYYTSYGDQGYSLVRETSGWEENYAQAASSTSLGSISNGLLSNPIDITFSLSAFDNQGYTRYFGLWFSETQINSGFNTIPSDGNYSLESRIGFDTVGTYAATGGTASSFIDVFLPDGSTTYSPMTDDRITPWNERTVRVNNATFQDTRQLRFHLYNNTENSAVMDIYHEGEFRIQIPLSSSLNVAYIFPFAAGLGKHTVDSLVKE
jgi:hypothetical protein